MGIRRIDTSYNYLDYTAHQVLAHRSGDLLERFSISTKVGFFPTGTGHSEHSLNPIRLHQAVKESVDHLGMAPTVVFLHNPEHTLSRLEPERRDEALATACTALATATAEGLCDAWGIASWNPLSLLPDHEQKTTAPAPQVFMTRAGLTVSARGLEAIETAAEQWDLPRERRWGMSPFAGHSTDRMWDQINARTFLDGEASCSNLAAAFRTAYELPKVSRVAVGTNHPGHLRELVQAARLPVNVDTIDRYRTLLSDAATDHRST
nr:aldo/keto reductase [Nocardiopsis alba]